MSRANTDTNQTLTRERLLRQAAEETKLIYDRLARQATIVFQSGRRVTVENIDESTAQEFLRHAKEEFVRRDGSFVLVR